MALIQCPECGGQVSNKAAACPHCGAPVAEKSGGESSCKLTVHRRGSGSMSALRFRISIDGEPALMGVDSGDSVVLLVTEGKHRVSFFVGGEELGAMDVMFQDNEDVELICWGDGRQILAKRKRDTEPAQAKRRVVSTQSPLVPQGALGSAAMQPKLQKKTKASAGDKVVALIVIVVGVFLITQAFGGGEPREQAGEGAGVRDEVGSATQTPEKQNIRGEIEQQNVGVEPVAGSESSAEILFRELPWLISPDEARQSLTDIPFMLVENCAVENWDDAGDQYTIMLGSAARGHTLAAMSPVDIAGYSATSMDLDFAYGYEGDAILRNPDDSRFYLATYRFDVIDIKAAYDDLKEKLTELYGNGKESNNTVSHYGTSTDFSGEFKVNERKTVWDGGNNTGIQLCAYYGESTGSPSLDATAFSLVLCYGKTDSDTMLGRIDNLLIAEQLALEAENRDPGNNSGL